MKRRKPMFVLGLLLLLAGGLIGVVVMVFAAGALIPREHTAGVRVQIDQAPEKVWGAMTDFEHATEWREGLKSIERLEDRDGKALWRETGKYGPMTIEITEQQPPARLVTTIADDGPWGGHWTYELEGKNGGTQVTITEEGFVNPPPFRFLSYFFFGYHSTLEDYAGSLARKFGSDASPEIVQ